MKYIVEVNAKYLVSVEAESVLNAEHKLLEYNGVWGALAFDRDMMKTDTFAGAVQGCEMVSMNEIYEMADRFTATRQAREEAMKAYVDADDEVDRLQKLLDEAIQARREAEKAKTTACFAFNAAEERFGKERR